MRSLRALLNDESGSVLTEYGVIMASLGLLTISGLLLVSASANALLTTMFQGTTNMEICPPGTVGC